MLVVANFAVTTFAINVNILKITQPKSFFCDLMPCNFVLYAINV